MPVRRKVRETGWVALVAVALATATVASGTPAGATVTPGQTLHQYLFAVDIDRATGC